MPFFWSQRLALLAKVAVFGPKKMALRVAKSKFQDHFYSSNIPQIWSLWLLFGERVKVVLIGFSLFWNRCRTWGTCSPGCFSLNRLLLLLLHLLPQRQLEPKQYTAHSHRDSSSSSLCIVYCDRKPPFLLLLVHMAATSRTKKTEIWRYGLKVYQCPVLTFSTIRSRTWAGLGSTCTPPSWGATSCFFFFPTPKQYRLI